jgi:hypothetical protein
VTNESLRLLERVHGHLGWLAAAALLHPAIVLRNPKRRARLSAVLSALFTTATAAFGAIIYPAYSRGVRRIVYSASLRYGMLFERKEHLAFAALALAWAGCFLHLSASGNEQRARAAHVAFVASAALTAAVATMGTLIASFRSF